MTPAPFPPRAPRAFRLDAPGIAVETQPDPIVEAQLEPEAADAHRAVAAIAHPRRRGVPWLGLAASAAGALVALAIGSGLDALLRDLFARAQWLGWLGAAALALFVVALAAIVGREALALFRLKRLARLRLDIDRAALAPDASTAPASVRALLAFYGDRPDLARARRATEAHLAEIIDPRDRLVLAERELVAPLDARARILVSAAARRVSVVTAVSPRAAFDVAFVLFESVRLVRRVAALYGGRPGTLGLLRLLKAVLTHLAVTGSLAVGDTVLQQFVGHGLAGRLSAKLGEGVVNGFMTARIGLSAMDVCRPMPFLAAERPRLKDLTAGLVSNEEAGALP